MKVGAREEWEVDLCVLAGKEVMGWTEDEWPAKGVDEEGCMYNRLVWFTDSIKDAVGLLDVLRKEGWWVSISCPPGAQTWDVRAVKEDVRPQERAIAHHESLATAITMMTLDARGIEIPPEPTDD